LIGLRTEDADKLLVTENAKLRARAEDMAWPEDQRPPIESDDMIARNLDTQGKRYLANRSALIARTESAADSSGRFRGERRRVSSPPAEPSNMGRYMTSPGFSAGEAAARVQQPDRPLAV
jgi:hypothetical protein